MRISRAERSLLGEWWYSLDGAFLAAMLLLMLVGLLASLAASPAVAMRIHLEPFFFVKRQALLLVPALILLIFASFLPARNMLYLGAALFVVCIILLVLTPFVGTSIKGARRWIDIGGFSLQPSEFIKPAFVLSQAYLLAWAQYSGNMRVLLFSLAAFLLPLGLLVLQPDYGQSVLLTLIWGGMFFMAGMPWLWLGGLVLLGSGGLTLAYLFVPHVSRRINAYLDPASGDNYQMGHALRSFIEGGWFGRGPGEGRIKQILPDAHADFVFSVLGEEFGILACLALLALFAFIVLRGLVHAHQDRDPFRRLALTGLMLLTGVQTFINMGVNTGLLPAKGMTLPFVSYGGSSLLAVALTMGLALGLARRHRGQGRFLRRLQGFSKPGG